MARLVVERSTIMAHLFSKPSCSTASDAVLSALLSVFSRYVQRMRKSKEGEEVYSWVRAEGWSSGVGLRWAEAGYRVGTLSHHYQPHHPSHLVPVPLPPLTVRVSGPSVLALDQWGDSHHAHPRCPRHGHPSDTGPASL